MPNGPARELTDSPRQRVARVRATLAQVGGVHFGAYPWHVRQDPYVVLLSEVLLQRTKRVVVARVLPTFLEIAPDAHTLASSDPDELAAVLRPTGLTSRVQRLTLLGAALVELGDVPRERDELLALPGVGEYVADAVLLYAFGRPTFPLDRNVQRVLMRVFEGRQPDKKLGTYADAGLAVNVAALTDNVTNDENRDIHQGVMAVAWSHCGPHPQHASCPLREHCRFARLASHQLA